jgi:hypothetical protein
MVKAFASQGDLEEKEVSFTELADGVYGYTAEGDPKAWWCWKPSRRQFSRKNWPPKLPKSQTS